MNWVQVRHRLPEQDKTVLVGFEDGQYDLAQLRGKRFFSATGCGCCGAEQPYEESIWDIDQPIHWAYLPEVPK